MTGVCSFHPKQQDEVAFCQDLDVVVLRIGWRRPGLSEQPLDESHSSILPVASQRRFRRVTFDQKKVAA